MCLCAIIIPSVLFTALQIYHKASGKISGYFQARSKRSLEYTFYTKDTARKGYILFTSTAPCTRVVVMDMSGHIFYTKKSGNTLLDFRKWEFNGKVFYSYAELDSAKEHSNGVVGSRAHIVILDSALNEIKQLHLLPFNDVVPGPDQDLDLHEHILLSEDHYIVMSNYIKHVNNIPACLLPAPGLKIPAIIIQEVLHGQVVWQWDATKFPEFYLNSEELNNFTDTASIQDYAHINGMVIDPRDSNLIVSFRNTNQLIKIDRKSGGIRWRLGGRNSDYPLAVDQVFQRQHYPIFAEDRETLLLFDNGEEKKRPYSRVLAFRLDEENKKVTSFKALNIPGAFSKVRGSVQQIGDNYFICGGSGKYIMEINSKTGAINMEIKTNQMSLYRAYFVNDVKGILATHH